MGTQNFEEMITFYHNMNLYCAIGALVFLALAVFLFIKLRIPQVLGELTGRTAKKAIDEMAAKGLDSGSLASAKIGEDGRRRRKTGKTGSLNSGRIRQNTGKISGNMNVDNTEPISGSIAPDTSEEGKCEYKFTYPEQMQQDDSYGSAETDVLDHQGIEETSVLDAFGLQETSVLDAFGSQETSALEQFAEYETDALSENGTNDSVPYAEASEAFYRAPESETMVLNQTMVNKEEPKDFVILRSIVEIHTDEVI